MKCDTIWITFSVLGVCKLVLPVKLSSNRKSQYNAVKKTATGIHPGSTEEWGWILPVKVSKTDQRTNKSFNQVNEPTIDINRYRTNKRMTRQVRNFMFYVLNWQCREVWNSADLFAQRLILKAPTISIRSNFAWTFLVVCVLIRGYFFKSSTVKSLGKLYSNWKGFHGAFETDIESNQNTIPSRAYKQARWDDRK